MLNPMEGLDQTAPTGVVLQLDNWGMKTLPESASTERK